MTPSDVAGWGVTRLHPNTAPQLQLSLRAIRFPEYTSGRSHGFWAVTGVQCESAPDPVTWADTSVTEQVRRSRGGSG
jgi:hypothetical protein